MSFHGQLFMYLAAFLLPLVLADVAFTKPAAGDVITGTSLVAAWTESHQNPSISTFESYQLFLCAGGNNETEFTPLFNLQPYATYSEGNKWSGVVSTGWGGNNTDAYFLQMRSTSACGGTVINYSKRFTISSMTGSFPPNVLEGLQTIGNDTNGPPTDQSQAGAALSCTSSVAAEPAATTSPSSATSISTSQPTSTDIDSSGPPPKSSPASSNSITLSSGALAGIVVTSIVVFAAISIIAIFLFRRNRTHHTSLNSSKTSFTSWFSRNKAMERLDSTAELAETAVCKELEADKRQPMELGITERAELPARRSIYEMPAS